VTSDLNSEYLLGIPGFQATFNLGQIRKDLWLDLPKEDKMQDYSILPATSSHLLIFD
jgi:hypothetical protein